MYLERELGNPKWLTGVILSAHISCIKYVEAIFLSHLTPNLMVDKKSLRFRFEVSNQNCWLNRIECMISDLR